MGQNYLVIIGATARMLGGVLIAYMALQVHYRFWKEHKVNEDIFLEMRHEQKVGVFGIAFLLIGYFIEIYL